jgi:hypothetical protein
LLADIVRFPVEQKADRLQRFGAQLLAWRWYHSEGIKKDNRYLILLAQQKVTLFSCRLVLTVNEMLYPYHKWMLRVVQTAPKQPPDFAARLEGILAGPSVDFMNAHCDALLEFVGLDPKAANEAWPTRFMHDTELRWLHDEPAIDDL